MLIKIYMKSIAFQHAGLNRHRGGGFSDESQNDVANGCPKFMSTNKVDPFRN